MRRKPNELHLKLQNCNRNQLLLKKRLVTVLLSKCNFNCQHLLLCTACDVTQFAVRQLDDSESAGLVHRAAAES